MSWKVVAVALLLVVLPVTVFAQRPLFDPASWGPPVRDPKAIAIIERVLTVLGGRESHLQLRTAALQGSVQIGNSQIPGSFAWEDDLSGARPEFRKELRVGDSVRLFVSGHGSPAESHDGTARQLLEHTALASPPLYLPGVVLARALKYPHISIRQIHDNTGLIHVVTSWNLNPVTAFITPQHWYFDPNTLLPVRVEYRVPDTKNAVKAQPASLEFGDFRSISGVAVPFRIVSSGPDGQTRVFTVTSAETNIIFNSNRFEVTGGG